MRRLILLASCLTAIACNLFLRTDGNPSPTSPPATRVETKPVPTAAGARGDVPGRPTATKRENTEPPPTPTIDPGRVLRWLCESNVYDSRNPKQGFTVRFAIPVAINAGGSKVVRTAIRNYSSATGGAVVFTVVDEDPPIGVTVIEGDAAAKGGGPGCGNVTSERAATSGHSFRVDPLGAFTSLTYVHLGSAGCDDEAKGDRPESVAEHELAHALGVGSHFPGFLGDEGLSPNLLAVVTMLYRLPPGTDMSRECGEQP
jgi:hypothetical protein